MIEPLEPRVLFASAPIDTSGVTLFTPDGSTPASLDKRREVWLVIHGLDSSKDDATMQALATAVDAASPDDQVLLVDWSKLADIPPDNATAVNHAWAAGDVLAAMVRKAGLRGSHVNLLGFSMGGIVESRLAKDLRGANRLIAVDPAAPNIAVDRKGQPVFAPTNFARYSRYSLAFYGSSYVNGGLSADDTIQMTNLQGSSMEQHLESLHVFTTMMRRDAGLEPANGESVSRLFSISNILGGRIPSWRKNSYGPGFEGLLSCNVTPASFPAEFEAVQLTYIDRHGHVVQV